MKCGVTNNGDVLLYCDKCDHPIHLTCAKITQEEVNKVLNYYCDDCENDAFITTWRREKATHSQCLDKQKNYFDVNNIVDHRGSLPKRTFLVEWKHYHTTSGSKRNLRTWEPERNLDGCIDLLQRYCRRKKISYSTIKGLLGADKKNETVNRRNWVSMETVIETFLKYKKQNKLNYDLPTQQWTNFGDEDALYFLDYQFHCLVLLYYHEEKQALIADGGNLFRENNRIAEGVRKLLGIRLISIPYDQQTKVDYCATSAVLIAFEFLRMHRDKVRLARIDSAKTYRKRLPRALHKHKSELLDLSELRKHRKALICTHCAKTYKSTDRRAYWLHLRGHKGIVKA